MINLAYLVCTGLIITGLIIIFALIDTKSELLEKTVPHFLNFALFLLLFNIFKNSSSQIHIIISSILLIGVIASGIFSVKNITN